MKKSAPTRTLENAQLIIHYRVPAGEAQSELVIKNSIFIGTVGRAPNVEAAHAFVTRVRATYADANHHAWAFKIDAERYGSSDDGEPGGTAGRPMLAVLEGSGLREVVVVGTRFWGGIKLGSGGLVRAYSGAAREALEQLLTVERTLHHLARFAVDYGLYGNLDYLLPRHQVKIEDKVFADKVTLTVAVPHERVGEVARLLSELTNGQVVLGTPWLEDRYDES